MVLATPPALAFALGIALGLAFALRIVHAGIRPLALLALDVGVRPLALRLALRLAVGGVRALALAFKALALLALALSLRSSALHGRTLDVVLFQPPGGVRVVGSAVPLAVIHVGIVVGIGQDVHPWLLAVRNPSITWNG